MRRIVLVPLVATLLTGWSGSAAADWLSGPIKVMRPDGSVFRIKSQSASAWWQDYRRVTGLSPQGRSRCDSCKGPRQAAQLLFRVERAVGTRLRAGPRYLILPAAMKVNWPRAWHFYPSTDETDAYVVQRGGIGERGKSPLQWDVWVPATDRMERMILARAADSSSPLSEDAVTDGMSPSTPLWRWLLIAGISAAFAVAGRLCWFLWRRRAPAA
jgi:hypothetical protein